MSSLNLTMPIEHITIGADPEVFFKNANGLVVPACGLVGGTKEEPIPVLRGALQEDNVMAEFNIDPADNIEDFVRNVNEVYSQLTTIARTNGLEVAHRASARLPMFLLQQHPQAMQFGCEPDFNAYTMKENPTPDVASTLRTCAGHVHLGYTPKDEVADPVVASKVVEYLDWIVGLWTVIEDSDTTRRERYGKAGAFRPKPYGLEYRVPSNFWLKTDTLKRTMFERVKLAYGLAAADSEKPSGDRVEDTINTHNVEECHRLLGGYAA